MNSKTKQIIKKISAAVFGLALISQAFIADTALAGVNPVFNSTLGLKNRTQNTATWQASVSANPGDRIAFDVYYKNTIPSTIAQNAKIRLDFEDNAGGQMRFKAYAYADNASYVYSLGYVTIDNSKGHNFTFDNTAKVYPNHQVATFNNVNVTFVQSNSVLVNIGQISGGDQYDGHVSFEGVISGSSQQNQQAQFNNASNDLETLLVSNVTRGDTTWQSSVTANPGDRIAFNVYYHNTGEGSVAHNTKARLNFPTTVQNQISVNGYVLADNVTPASDTATVSLNNNATANLTFGSTGSWYPHQTTVSQSVNISQSYGTVEFNMGDVAGTCQDQGHMVFEATLSGTVGSPNLTITKTVKNVTDQTSWTSSVNANPGERVSFKIDIYSNGQTAAQNVIFKDTLPSNMTYSGNLYIDGAYSSYSAGSLASGINLGTINAGSSKSITFDADLYADNYFGSGSTLLTNYAYASASNFSQIQSSAQVNVQKTTQTSANFTMDKLVRNITRGEFNWVNSTEAYPGEVVDFSLKVTNTGNTVATGIYVKDTLPSKLNYYDNVKVDGVIITGNIISGIYLGDLAANSSKTVTFQAVVASANNFNFGYTSLTNSGTAYNSYNSSVNEAIVVVNKKAVEGAATEVNTGLKEDLMNYLLLPALLALGLIVLFKDSLFKFDQWLVLRGSENRNYRSQRMLDKKINQIRDKESTK